MTGVLVPIFVKTIFHLVLLLAIQAINLVIGHHLRFVQKYVKEASAYFRICHRSILNLPMEGDCQF